MNTTHFLRAVLSILSLAVAVPASAQCTGDLTGNGIVDGADLGTILAYWGPRTQDPTSVASDLNGDGLINGADLGVLLASWGSCQSTITSITPNQGCIVGGTQITITGTYLGSTIAVTVGGAPATSFTVVNQNTVQATTPAGTLGRTSVRVTTAAGTILDSPQFTYMPMSVSSIIPNLGPTTGGTQITISGDYVASATSVNVGGAPCSALAVVNSSTVTVVTPPGSLGNADVVIMGGKGTVTVPGGYRYASIAVPGWATLVEAQPDPAVVSDPALRASIAVTGLAWRVRDTATQIEMVLIPPGTFQMGCVMGSEFHRCIPQEQPVHEVTLTNPFYMGRYEITQSQWMAKIGSNPSYFQGAPDSASRPVEQVSWNTVQGFLAATAMRLPTEAEWEYACRAGTPTPFYNGSTADGTLGELAWYSSNSSDQTHAVGGKAGNDFGLQDMLGNVWEWVNDWYGTYPSNAQTNPTGPAGAAQRVIRGASWGNPGGNVRSSNRSDASPDEATIYRGFRVARNP
jgi:formylglycine-generating enzyme required for sulfatase activity